MTDTAHIAPADGNADDTRSHGGGRGLANVEFIDLNTNDRARFSVPPNLTLQRAWDMAYDELGEARRPSDTLENRKGDNLAAYLGSTIDEVRRLVDPSLHFQIHGEQGGA